MRKPELSIIIPAYNAAATIERTLGTILAQTGLRQAEIIVVDDGSTDNTGAILDKIAAHTPNMTVIHQQNAGVSAARNAAIKCAHGKYITLVDSDDMVGVNATALAPYFSQQYNTRGTKIGNLIVRQTKFSSMPDIQISYNCDYFTKMLDAAHKTNADVVMAGKITVNADASYIKSHMYEHDVTYGPDVVAKAMALKHADCRENANFALYRRDFLAEHKLNFVPGIHLDEDILFCMTAVLHAKNVATVADVAYLYTRHNDSLSNITCQAQSNMKYSVANVQRFSLFLDAVRRYPQYASIYTHWLKVFSKMGESATSANEAYPYSACMQCPSDTCVGCYRDEAMAMKLRKNIQEYIPQRHR